MFFEILQISQGNTSVEVSFQQSCRQTCNFIKKRLQHRSFAVEFTKFLRRPNLNLRTNASKTISFSWAALFNNLHFWLKLIHMLQSLYIHMQQFCLPILPSLLLILSSRPVLFCKKGVLTDFAKFTTKHQKKTLAQMFSLYFLAKFLITSFFKELFGRLLLHKHSLCLLSNHALSPFQKRCYTYFLAEYFSA